MYSRLNNSWSQQAYIKPSTIGAGDTFGISVALSSDGKALAVGASGEESAATAIGGDQADNSADNAGAVFMFLRANEEWSQETYIKASNSEKGDYFGGFLTMSGDANTLAVSASHEQSSAVGIGGDQADNLAFQSGAVYLF